MIRSDDGTDLGAWSAFLPASELRVPLDTHWVRIGPRLGMTSRRTHTARTPHQSAMKVAMVSVTCLMLARSTHSSKPWLPKPVAP
jgi:hypothetical protein